MRPHLAHINNTLIRKQLANEAGNKQSAYSKYRQLVTKARELGFDNERILLELEEEKNRVKGDIRMGDSIHLQGVANAQNACMVSISMVMAEIREGKL